MDSNAGIMESPAGARTKEKKEHLREINKEVAAHPLVTHFREEHGGETQEILMRVVVTPMTALEHKVWESVMIDRCNFKERSFKICHMKL